jgi:cytochrome P450
MHTDIAQPLFRPPAPAPLRETLGLVQYLRQLRANPLTTWTQEHFEKPIVATESALGRITVVSDPGAIRYILVDNAGNYRKDDVQRRILAPALGKSLVTVEDEEWKLQRRTIAPLFAARHVTSFFPAMARAGERVVRRWRRHEGRVVDASLEMTRVTLDVLEQTVFTHGVMRDPDALGRAITRYFEALGPVDPLDILGFPDWLPRIGRLRARPAIRFFEETVDELIEARRKLIARGGKPPADLLTLLLEAADPETGQGLSEVEVRANIATFIGAGHETTANALSWSLYLLSQAPDVRARVEREVDEVAGERPLVVADLSRLAFTRAVVDEALRFYPPAPLITRAAVADDRIARVKIPKGSMVAIAPWVLHRHRRLWHDPDAFDPDRFMPERHTALDRFAYLPFGAGPRVCIGASFALQEAVTVLASIVRAVRLDLVDGHVVQPLQRVTLRPQGGLPMRLSLRPSG